MTRSSGFRTVWFVVTIFLALAGQTQAVLNWGQGFDDNTDGWIPDLAINSVPSGGGVLGLPSADGTGHAEIYNLPNAYQPPTHGEAGFSRLPSYAGADVYSGDFYQALSIYIDAENWAPPALPASAAFWLDQTPTATNGMRAFGPPFSSGNDEQSFNFYVPTMGTVNVGISGGASVLSITNSGWYSFVETFRRTGPLVTDLVENDFLIYDVASRTLISSNTITSGLPSPELAGHGYSWLTVWQNGFANDILAIDNSGTGPLPFVPIPEPTTAALTLSAVAVLLRSRRTNA